MARDAAVEHVLEQVTEPVVLRGLVARADTELRDDRDLVRRRQIEQHDLHAVRQRRGVRLHRIEPPSGGGPREGHHSPSEEAFGSSRIRSLSSILSSFALRNLATYLARPSERFATA